VGIICLLGMLVLAAPSAEARFRVKLPSMPKPRSAPTVSKPHTTLPRPDAPKAHININTASKISGPVAARAPDNRGFFGRLWDRLLGRRPEPAQAPSQTAPHAVAAAPAAPATPGVVVPVVPVRPVTGLLPPGVQSTGQEQEKDKRGVAGLEESLQQLSAKFETEARRGQGTGGSAMSPGQGRPTQRPNGYILHLTNGRSIPVAHYEEKGDQVVIPQLQGSYGLQKSLISRIEPRGLESGMAGERRR
jgi:hypothetical protein